MEEVRKLFAERGLRCTKQRLAIYRALAATRSHPTAEELHDIVQHDARGLSLATVYNTLEALCDAGLCRRLPVTRGSSRYDADLHPHLHVVDRESGRYIDVPDDLGRELLEQIRPEVLEQIEHRLGVRIDRVSLNLLGAVGEHADN
ncbi:MAG: Fur family transcriptional regulator [Phycisphaerales bacterium]